MVNKNEIKRLLVASGKFKDCTTHMRETGKDANRERKYVIACQKDSERYTLVGFHTEIYYDLRLACHPGISHSHYGASMYLLFKPREKLEHIVDYDFGHSFPNKETFYDLSLTRSKNKLKAKFDTRTPEGRILTYEENFRIVEAKTIFVPEHIRKIKP
jgi:hypothetical protein